MHLRDLKCVWLVITALLSCYCVASGLESEKPLVVARQGSFFVGGQVKVLPDPPPGADSALAGGDITINQMYVQYQIPLRGDRRAPVVMVHGCCLSSKTWETTPDGRMGWSEYFVRKQRSVYLADQVSRARSGFDPSTLLAFQGQLPQDLSATHQGSWISFRFGPSYLTVIPGSQFPIESVDELYKQMIPDLNELLPKPNPTLVDMATLAKQLKVAVLMGHSESGFFPEQAALIDPSGLKAMISIEPGECTSDLTAEQVARLARIPTLIVFGDYLNDVKVNGVATMWQHAFSSCGAYVQRVNAAGGQAQMMHLPEIGIRGNSHMLMQDRNNLQIADLILGWTDRHVGSRN